MLTKLPDDILFLICAELPALDIMTLRQTCKALHEVTSRRFVWIKAINQMCERDNAYRPSFATNGLELPQLQAIATAPERWSRLIESYNDAEDLQPEQSILKPVRVRNFSAAITADTEGMWPTRIFLVPGGRFLLTMTGLTLAVWDLEDSSIEKPLASINQKPLTFGFWRRSWRMVTQISADAQTIRALLYSEKGLQSHIYQYIVYEISPASDNPSLQVIANLEVKSSKDLSFTSVWGDRLVLIHGAVIKMWNFITDEWATWRVDKPPCQILMLKDSITLVYSDYLTIWDIPKVTPNAQNQALLEEPIEIGRPRYKKLFRTTSDVENHLSPWCNGLDDFFTGSHQPLWFDFRTSSEDKLVVDRFLFELHPDPTHTEDDEEPLTPIMTLEYPYQGVHGMLICPCRPCNGGVYTFWHDRLGIYCEGGLMTTGATKRSHVKVFLGPSAGPIEVDHSKTTFCPVSGRLCYSLWKEGFTPRPLIYVVDFLGPATSTSTLAGTANVSSSSLGWDETAVETAI
ncbi:hypothetical protein BJ165DRAFT_1477975 [Panaeolus papilionaceus]|nr:hypothetical protein BJ165DRAFT_1477975 [Panaeolus papilionaceus]